MIVAKHIKQRQQNTGKKVITPPPVLGLPQALCHIHQLMRYIYIGVNRELHCITPWYPLTPRFVPHRVSANPTDIKQEIST